MSTDKRRLLVIGIALVAVMALAFAGYQLLGRNASAADATQATGAASDAGNGSGTTSTSTTSSKDTPLLADYDATVYTEQKDPVKLTAIAGGKPLVINFWATWCPYCIQEMPDYLDIYREYGDRVSFAFVDATDGQSETVSVAAAWLKENGFSELPAYYDTDLEATAIFAARALPTTVVVDADGKIQGVSAGAIDPGRLRSALDALV